MSNKQTGTLPYQTPLNADLGSLAYQNKDSVKVDAIKIGSDISDVTQNKSSFNFIVDSDEVYESTKTTPYQYIAEDHEMAIMNMSNDVTGSYSGIYFQAGQTSPGLQINSARISAVRESGFDTSLRFMTRQSGGTHTERLKLYSGGAEFTGTVGINMTNTSNVLTIEQTTGGDANPAISIFGPGGVSERAKMYYDNVQSFTIMGTSYPGGGSVNSYPTLSFATSGANPGVRMYITRDGHISIGGDAPSAQLQVKNIYSGYRCAQFSPYQVDVNQPSEPTTVRINSQKAATLEVSRFYSWGKNIVLMDNGTEVGSISTTSSATTYNTSSDYRLKENIAPLSGAIDRVKQLNPIRFNFISTPDQQVDGFLAHEVALVVPNAVTGEKDEMRTETYEVSPEVVDENGMVVEDAVTGTREVPEYQGLDHSKLVPILVAAIQELEERVAQLESQ